MPRVDATVLDIVLACRRILRFASGLSRETFLDDDKSQSAVVPRLLLVGEDTKRLSDEFRDGHPEVPWRDIARMRDRLYDAVDLDEV